MFDRIAITPARTETQYVTRTVHEHRAPTDKSVELLREMEAAADAKRIAAMTIPGNEFNGLVEVMEDAASLRTEAVAVFDLNGRRITSRADVDRCDLNKPELYKALRDRMAKDIASEILIRIAPKT